MPEDAGADVSRETFERLSVFEALLLKWSAKINLIGRNEGGVLGQRHIGDSLRLTRIVPQSGCIVDLGSGAGFPGLIVAIVLDRHVTLVEADQRKAAFLREAARIVAAPVTIISQRIELCGLKNVDVITARALAPLWRLLALAAPLLANDGVCLLPKGRRVNDEVTRARRDWHMTIRRHEGITTHSDCILEVNHLRRIQP